MPKYALFFTFTPETVARMIDQPSDRAAAVTALAQSVGGKLETYYWMTGPHDGFVIVDAPDTVTAAAVSLGVASSRAFGHLETYELFGAEALGGLLQKAKQARSAYRPPGGGLFEPGI
jgi:uncharacterized protein with GYD domain